MARVKVYNENNYHVGIELENKTTRDIAPHSFALLTEDDIAFIMSTCRLFSDKHLVLKDEATIENLGVEKESCTFYSDEEIASKLKKSNGAALKKFLSGITQPHLQSRVVEIARAADLAGSKNKAIEEAFGVEV